MMKNHLNDFVQNSSVKWMTSAITPTQPAITAALACAPDMPPKPEVTYTFPFKSCTFKYFRPAFITVNYETEDETASNWKFIKNARKKTQKDYGGAVNDSLRSDVAVTSGRHLSVHCHAECEHSRIVFLRGISRNDLRKKKGKNSR